MRKIKQKSDAPFFQLTFIFLSMLIAMLSIGFFLLDDLDYFANIVGVQRYLEISNQNADGGMAGEIEPTFIAKFGYSVDSLGDLNADGVDDLVTADGRGSVYVLFLNRNGSVASYVRIADGVGGFDGVGVTTAFASSVATIGDLDDDGVMDIVVGDPGANDDDGGIWVIFLNADGTVKSEQMIAGGTGGFFGTIPAESGFGNALTAIGDLDGDDVEDIVVGHHGHEALGGGGAIWVIFLNTDGTVKNEQLIAEGTGGFSADLNDDSFGDDISNIGDLNLDGVTDLVVGASGDESAGTNVGAVWILFMNTDGTVQSEQRIAGQAEVTFGVGSRTGNAVEGAGKDLNEDGIPDIYVASRASEELRAVYLNRDGTPKGEYLLSEGVGGFEGQVSGTIWPQSIAIIDLLPGGIPEIFVGGREDSVGGVNSLGALWYIILNIPQTGDQNFVTPKSNELLINEGASCVTSREVYVELFAEDARDVVVGTDSNFINADWEPYTGSPMSKVLTLPDRDGMHTIYVRYRSSSHNQSILDYTSVQLDREGNCGVVDSVKPVCEQNCEDMRFQFFLTTPLGEEIVSDGERVRVERSDTQEIYYFEDKDDFDFNDITLVATRDKCSEWNVRIATVNAGWHHGFGVRVFYKSEEVEKLMLSEDSHEAIGEIFTFNTGDYYPVCEEVIE